MSVHVYCVAKFAIIKPIIMYIQYFCSLSGVLLKKLYMSQTFKQILWVLSQFFPQLDSQNIDFFCNSRNVLGWQKDFSLKLTFSHASLHVFYDLFKVYKFSLSDP